jgi:hypothetical protein
LLALTTAVLPAQLLPAETSANQEVRDAEPPEANSRYLPYRVQPARKTASDTDSLGNPVPDTLSLPFFDNFSGPYTEGAANHPDTNLWFDSRTVFTFRTSAINPPDVGTVEFDGTNDEAERYITVVASGTADSLLSQAFDLSSYSAADNIYLSFWVQPGGLADNPEDDDFLRLFFLDEDTNWVEQLVLAPGDTTSFLPVAVPVNQPEYLHGGFQFKFENTAALTGHYDVWHLDYVSLDINRSLGDTVQPDAAVQNFARSILDTPYTHMTLREYNALRDDSQQ